MYELHGYLHLILVNKHIPYMIIYHILMISCLVEQNIMIRSNFLQGMFEVV